jgi:Methyltransferase domain
MTTTFSEQQYEMCYPPGIESHWWTLARNQLLTNILRREAGGTGVFLEVGCGKGVVVKTLSDVGFNIRGVELADVTPVPSAQFLVDSGTDACELPIERRAQVTGLLLLDVIEHLPEPEQFLRRLEASFPKLEIVIITVPTCHEIWSNFDDFCGHYRRYTLAMLEALSTDLNWKIKSAGYFFRLSYLPMRLMSLLGINRNTTINAPRKVMRPLHRLVAAVCRLELALVPRQIRGSSAYAVYYPDKVRRQ